MTGRLVAAVLLLLVAAIAYGMSLRYMYHGVYEIHVILGESQPEPVDEVLPDGSTRRVTISGVFPVMMPSLWLPDGTPGLTYSFTRATALFNITADPKNDFIWYVPPTLTIYYKESTLASGLNVYVSTYCNGGCPNDVVAHIFDITFANKITGEKFLYVEVTTLFSKTYCAGGECTGKWPLYEEYINYTIAHQPSNITAVLVHLGGRWHRLDVYVDGAKAFTYTIIGDEVKFDWAYASIGVFDTATALRPVGSLFLLIGDDTVMAPPRYVIKADAGRIQARVELTYDGGVVALPGRTYSNSSIYEWPLVDVTVEGRHMRLPYRALVNASKFCPYGFAASGRYRLVGSWVEVRGPVSIRCTKYPVTFVTPAGNMTVVADVNTTLTWQPPPVYWGGGAVKLEADPVSVYVDGPKTVYVRYTRIYYLVRVSGFNGTWELWVPRGGELELPAAVLDNGTRLVIREATANGRPAAARIKVEEPLNVTLRYGRQYLVKLEAPVNSTAAWADEGSVFKVGLADPWKPGNGTLFKRLLVNGTAQREFRVDKPMTLRAQYAETYYWVEVVAPVNSTRNWMAKGAVLKFPDIVDFGNGTRLIKPSVREVAVEGPVALKVEYAKKQYYVKIEGVNRWEGWADARSLIRLNATVVDGVEYTPFDEVDAVVVAGPGVYRPLFYAAYRTVARDVLGVPNPLATVKLCNATAQAGLAGFVVVETYTVELCQPTVEAFPISPYTAAGAVALAAAFALKKRKK
jgi:hypothetical protein